MDDGVKTAETSEAAVPAAMTRRALMRGATIVVPTILTLHSGAALAQSSNLLGATNKTSAEGSKYRCLDTSSVYRTDKPNVYDLGEKPMAHVTTTRSTKQYYKSDYSGKPVGNAMSGQDMCTTGGKYLRKDGSSYVQVNVKRGVLVSATALSSFANDITYTDV